MEIENDLLDRGLHCAKMTDEPTQHALGKGLLLECELKQIAELYIRHASVSEIDDQARGLLAHRDALTGWEISELVRGATCFIFGAHRIADSIGVGALHQVYLAQHLYVGRVDVLKVLPQEKATPERIADHRRRVLAHSSVICDRIVQICNAGYERNVHYSIVEHVRGINLRRLVRGRAPLTMDSAAAVITQTAIALEALQASGLVFGNLRPTKLLVTESTEVKLCDAGMGVCPGPTADVSNNSDAFVDYLAPEVIAGDEVTPISDVYSLGCVLYFAVTGEVPFPGGTPDDKRRGHTYLWPLDPRRLANGLDNEFVDIIAAMMAKQPDRRIQSAAEVVERLAPWVTPRSC